MSPLRERPPWSELAALLCVGLGVASWSLSGRAVSAEGLATLALGLVCALAPRRSLDAVAPVAAEAALIAGALGAALIATTVAGPVPPTHALRVVHALLFGELLGVATAMAAALPLRSDTLRRAIAPALLVAAIATLGLWPGARRDLRFGLFTGAAAAALGALYHLHAVRRPLLPVERARIIAPGVGAVVLALAALLRAMWGESTSPLVLALGVTAQVLGLTAGTGAIGLDRAAQLARRAVAAGLGLTAGAALGFAVPQVPLLGVCAAMLVTLAAWPIVERRLRPDRGRLLDACDEIERALPSVRDDVDLAAAVLDPLRAAARNLRAPAAIWLLSRGETLHVDVSGGARRAPLSMEHARPIIAWLRARPGAVFSDTLRPYEVRRAELRPLIAALDAVGAIGAAPLRDGDELVGALVLPRGARVTTPSYEEQLRVESLARSVEGVLSLLASAERARARSAEATSRADDAVARAADERGERERLIALHEGARQVRALEDRDAEWVAYSPRARALRERALALSPRGPVALVSEVGAGAVAVARLLHDRHRPKSAPFVALDASAHREHTLLASLLGDARETPERAGWLEHAAGGTLVIEELPALGHDALVALVDALRTGTARRVGAERSYEVEVALVATLRDAPLHHDLPRALLEMLAERTLLVPPLRDRIDDLESLTLMALDRACRAQGRRPLGLAPDAAVALRAYSWPGNVVELFEVMDHAVARVRGARVGLDDLPPAVRSALADDPDEGDDDRTRAWRGDA